MSSPVTPELAASPQSPSGSASPPPDALRARIEELEERSGARAIAVVVFDEETGREFAYQPDRWFHAASTIKLAILLGVYDAVHRGLLVPHSRLHVRNRFFSALDSAVFRVAADRDADAEVHQAIGKTMRIDELAKHMITVSSNLATNLLLDLIGVETTQRTIDALGLHGIDLRRGVEDERAFERGVNNLVTAAGLVSLLRLIVEERAFTPALSREILEIMHQQQFRAGIPSALPPDARVANKTGDISTVAHDVAAVYLPNRKPYVLAVLTEWDEGAGRRSATISAASYAVYEELIRGDDDA
jgi:beta-lactamase class A